MSYIKILYVGAYCLFGTLTAWAQVNVKKSPKSLSYRPIHVSRAKAPTLCPGMKRLGYPAHGIGIKLGDPFAITYKFYPNKRWALVAEGGLAPSGLYNQYYKSLFNNFLPQEILPSQTYTYNSHQVIYDWIVEFKALAQWQLSAITKGLHIYTGIGWQLKGVGITYVYNFEDRPQDIVEIRNIREIETNQLMHGAMGIIGFEYARKPLPVAAFIEVEVFVNTSTDLGHHNIQGGVGIRYLLRR